MKITSSTSMTSMYGTTLIWFIRRCFVRFSTIMSVDLALKDVRQLFHEGIEADRKAIHVAREVVVRNDRRNSGQKAHRRCDQRFGDAWRDVTERRLGDVR